MTDEEISEIEKRCDAARAGPWKPWVEGRDHDSGPDIIQVGETAVPNDDMESYGATAADLDFMAHARTDVPRLIAEVKRLRRQT